VRALWYLRGEDGPDVAKSVDDSEEPVPATASVVAGSVAPPAVQRFRLRGLGGEIEGRSFDSSSDRLQIGSHPLNEIEVRDRTVSRFHCEVFIDRDGRAWVKDLGSRNGTRVNGQRVREAELLEGMVLRVGQLELVFTPLAERNELPVAPVTSFGTLVGSSLPLRTAFAQLVKAAASDVTLLLSGESGTGKSEAAELLHEQSRRAGKPLRVVDCAAVPAISSSPSSSGTSVARSPGRFSGGSACSRRRRAEPCSSTRWASFPGAPAEATAGARGPRGAGWAPTATSRSISASSPRPTGTCERR
jgi:pSer/pThr/pTyr-binding forkhead associated (FHA) protein